MSAFDRIIGYETIKDELRQISDIVKNRELYERMGAKLPKGLLLYGDPGLGKSLMIQCLIEECGIKSITVRKNVGGEDFVGTIEQAFMEAKQCAPCIIFFDDMDKYANEDEKHPNAEEYVAIQAGIDFLSGEEVYIFATVNEMDKLPDSLCRSGRFDKKVEVLRPTEEDACEIINYYLADKKLADDVVIKDLEKMISYHSCAELETILNEAAIRATYRRKSEIEMSDIVQTVLRMQYNAPDDYSRASQEDLWSVALHEAGHAVVCEKLVGQSVGMVSIRNDGRSQTGGFMHRCAELNRRQDIMVLLGGKAAVEMFNSDTCASGCAGDIDRAIREIHGGIVHSGTHGIGLLPSSGMYLSDDLNTRIEAVAQAEMEKAMFRTKEILINNRSLLVRMAQELMEKRTLLYSDVQRICGECEPE